MPVIITKPGAISKEKQTELKEIGYVVIEADNPNEISVLDETASVDGNLLLTAAFEAMSHGSDDTIRRAFGNILREKMLKKIKRLNQQKQNND